MQNVAKRCCCCCCCCCCCRWYLHVRECVHMYMIVCIRVCTHARAFVRICACMRVYVCVPAFVFVCVCVFFYHDWMNHNGDMLKMRTEILVYSKIPEVGLYFYTLQMSTTHLSFLQSLWKWFYSLPFVKIYKTTYNLCMMRLSWKEY